MTGVDRPQRKPKRSNVADSFLGARIEKLEKRLKHQRAAGKTLDPNSVLMMMNDSVVFEMETKLFKLKHPSHSHLPR